MEFNRIEMEHEYFLVSGKVTVVRIPEILMPAFQQLIARGINTWDQAPQEIKDFADELSGNDKLLNNSSQT